MPKPRKPIAELIEELRSWLPNYDHGPDSFPNTFYRIIASLPGGEELEDIGYEPMPGIGWHEADLLGRVLVEIQGKHDVEDLVQGLIQDEEGEVEEVRRRPAAVLPAGAPFRRPLPPPGGRRLSPPDRRRPPARKR